jgi:beta-lactamase class C
MKASPPTILPAVLLALLAAAPRTHAADPAGSAVKTAVDSAIQPLMAKDRLPGMAVAIAAAGKTYVFNYGVASTETRRPVTRDTLFEIGSVTKTFTATLACYAQLTGHLSLSDKVGKYLPLLRDTEFGEVALLNLATHTPGGLPLQVPDDIRNNDQLIQYFKSWHATYQPGTYRTYANPGIGTLGLITSRSMGQEFASLMEQLVFRGLGMNSSCIDVPPSKMTDYAQGYTKDDAPIRMAPGVLSSEAYGVRTTAADLIRFVEANMTPAKSGDPLRRAIAETHTGYFKAGPMTQDLIWEQYPYPVELKTLLQGNSADMIYTATPVTRITPPEQPRADVLIDKTGSTNGFAAYVLFVPVKQLGIVILANKSYPIDERVTTAYQILTALAGGKVGDRR